MAQSRLVLALEHAALEEPVAEEWVVDAEAVVEPFEG
jgi:hypothetical protein